MTFEKKGLICGPDTLGLSWYKKNAMVPVPYLLNESVIRIYLTMCDERNVGRIGWVDVSAENPSEILGYSKEPIIDVGMPGTYDDNGVVTSSILEHDGKLYLYFSGYELSTKIPYKIFCGVAESADGGHSFKKLNAASILPALDEELFNRCAPYVREQNGKFRMYYLGDAGNMWRLDKKGHKVPMYTLRTLVSDNPIRWPYQPGSLVMPFLTDEECGLTLPNIWQENGIYKMIYSIRRVNLGYTLGYSESQDGATFIRKDEELRFVGPQQAWDAEMMCFAELIRVRDRTFMFYSGNHYGIGGMGWAELVK